MPIDSGITGYDSDALQQTQEASMKILVTGGLGFLGSHLVQALAVEHSVIVVDPGFKSTYAPHHRAVGTLHSLGPARVVAGRAATFGARAAPGIVEWHQKESRHLDKLMGYRLVELDQIYHLGHIASPTGYRSAPLESLWAGSLGTHTVASLAEDAGARLLLASTSEVYGDPEVHPQVETYRGNVDPIGPRSMYDEAKRYAEAYLAAFARERGVDVRIARIFNCYDDQTEVLTNSGFRFFKDLDGTERFATLNPDTMALEYHHASDYVTQPFEGEMLHFKGASYDLKVTPNHRMLVWQCTGDRTDGKSFQPSIVPAEDIPTGKEGSKWRLLRAGCSWEGASVPTHVIPGRSPNSGPGSPERIIDMGDWCEFMGWFISEGSAFECGPNKSHKRVVISQHKSVNPENYKRISSLLRRMGFNPYEARHNLIVTSAQLFEEIKRLLPMSGSENKLIPREVLDLESRYLERIFEALMLGDGTGWRKYTTKSEALVDGFTELAMKVGRACTTSHDGKCFRISVSSPDSIGANMPRMGIQGGGVRVEKVLYTGTVYDVTVPNHLLYVRRNGKTCWSGNTYGPGMGLDDGRMIPAFMRAAFLGSPIPVHEPGTQTRTLCYVDDMVRGLIRLMNSTHWRLVDPEVHPVNLGGVDEVSVMDVARHIVQASGLVAEIETIPQPDPQDPKVRKPDISRACELLAWHPLIHWGVGLTRTVAYEKELFSRD